ncbi:MAG: Sir2 family NAD-dependent protein deacetylase [Stellaceae bacterium]
MSTLWAQPRTIVAFSGAGLAREAGFAPFDPDAMPAGLRLEDIVTREGFARDPARVRGFYNLRRHQLLETKPTAAHEGLAVVDAVRPREILIVTGNIDDLHERAGSQAVIHLHGELMKARCMICTEVSERYDDITEETGCPVCGNKGHLRPHVVWVGEEPLHIASVYEALADAALFLAIGAAGGSELAKGFLAEARRTGARTVEFPGEFGREPAPDSGPFDERIPGPLSETVPEYVKRLIAGS